MNASPRSSLAGLAAAMRDPDPRQGWDASKAALDHGLVLVNLATVETLFGWAKADLLKARVANFIAEVEADRPAAASASAKAGDPK